VTVRVFKLLEELKQNAVQLLARRFKKLVVSD
jgi:hypothetical protein